MQAVKLCSNIIVQFLLGMLATQVVLYNGSRTVVIVVVISALRSLDMDVREMK